jgi:hypothetical protein
MSKIQGVLTNVGASTGTAAKTLLQLIAPANQGIKMTKIAISFAGVNNTQAPIRVDILRQSTAGTVTGATPVKREGGESGTLQATGGKDASAEPTPGDVLETWYVHPQTGLDYVVPDQAPITIGQGGRLGLRVTSANDIAAACSLAFEE